VILHVKEGGVLTNTNAPTGTKAEDCT